MKGEHLEKVIQNRFIRQEGKFEGYFSISMNGENSVRYLAVVVN